MTKFLLGVAVGYVFRDVIDELVRYATGNAKNMPKPPEPPTTSEEIPVA